MKRTSVSLISIVVFFSTCTQEDFLDGYDTQSLFAEPTVTELEEVLSDWKSRDLTPANYKIEQLSNVSDDGTVLKIVSFRVNGYREYGALLIPKADGPLPVHMYIGGFSHDDPAVNAIKLVKSADLSTSPFIFAFPALRGQSLSVTINDIEYPSDVSQGPHCDAFDGAADDAIAFLNVIQQTEAQADMSRVAVRGGSRGGTVALLTGIRDKRVKLVIDVAGPTNMLSLTSTHENDATYQCQFLQGLVHNMLTTSQTRHIMIASSPLYFADQLPNTQLHLAQGDRIVPVSQGEELKMKMETFGNEENLDLFIYQGRDHSNIANDNSELVERIAGFLEEL